MAAGGFDRVWLRPTAVLAPPGLEGCGAVGRARSAAAHVPPGPGNVGKLKAGNLETGQFGPGKSQTGQYETGQRGAALDGDALPARALAAVLEAGRRADGRAWLFRLDRAAHAAKAVRDVCSCASEDGPLTRFWAVTPFAAWAAEAVTVPAGVPLCLYAGAPLHLSPRDLAGLTPRLRAHPEVWLAEAGGQDGVAVYQLHPGAGVVSTG